MKMEEIGNVSHFIFLINTQGVKSFAARDEVCFSNWTTDDEHSIRLGGERRKNVSQFSLLRITSGPGFCSKVAYRIYSNKRPTSN